MATTKKYQDGGSAPVTGFEKRQAKKIAKAQTRSVIANIEGEGTVSQKRDNRAKRISSVIDATKTKTPKRLSTSTSSSTSTTDNRNSGNTTNTTNSGSSSGSSSGSTSGASGGQGGQGGSGGRSGSSSGVDNSRKSSTSVKQTQNNTRTNNNTSNTNVRQSQNNSRNSSKTILNDNSRKSSVKQKSTTKVKMQNGGVKKMQNGGGITNLGIRRGLEKTIDRIKKGPGRDINRSIYGDRMYDIQLENRRKIEQQENAKKLGKSKLKKSMYGSSMMKPSMMKKGGTKKK